MALASKSLFLYGYSITSVNQNLDFVAVSGGPVLTAVIALGQYSLTTLLSEIKAAIQNADLSSGAAYTVVADRTVMGGTQNRITISTTGSYLKLLFGTGPNSNTSIAPTIGFNKVDLSGQTHYTGITTTGISLMPSYIGYNFADQNQQARLFGAVNISASGLKEAVVFNEQYFIDVEFKYEPKSSLPAWVSLRDWMISQAPFDFTPEIANPNNYSPVTLEKSQYGQNGMGFLMKEMLPDFPNEYTTGPMNMRVVLDYNTSVFIT